MRAVCKYIRNSGSDHNPLAWQPIPRRPNQQYLPTLRTVTVGALEAEIESACAQAKKMKAKCPDGVAIKVGCDTDMTNLINNGTYGGSTTDPTTGKPIVIPAVVKGICGRTIDCDKFKNGQPQ